ncbi:MAG: extracellular solute-binding protein [Azoarcus sp.]|jgi:ABC-type Fe3+ transport system substrate-binding protein|nr:extracellular solute-binding protein [Azoarcus sp.]
MPDEFSTPPRIVRRRLVAGLLLAGAVCFAMPAALSAPKKAKPAAASENIQKVVVLTSYPEELSTRFQKAFETAHPGTRVEILWRHSADALAYLRRGGISDIDVYWTPAPRNFAVLKAEGKLAKLPAETRIIPLAESSASSISDPDGYYAAFELAGYGIAYHPDAVKNLGLPPPKDWSDLGHPAYRGKVQMPIPGRVGFAPVMAEAVLQGNGWDKSWADFAAIVANMRIDRGDSTNETDDVSSGRVAARMTIDFFTLPSRRNATPGVGEFAFVYPPKTAFNPSHVAISAKAPHPKMARDFVDFVLSKPAQELLLEHDVKRLPARKDVYDGHPELKVRPFVDGNLAYDDKLRRDRQGLVAAIFDIALIRPHAQSVPLWDALENAKKEKRGNEARLKEIQALLTAIPVSETEQRDEKLRRLFDFPDLKPGEPEPAISAERQAVEARWKAEVEGRLNKARQLLQAL